MPNFTERVYIRRNLNGFTLAEVLITLAIIGVVAALTIPSVVQNYRKTQTVTQLKKVYSALTNTTNLAIAEYGPIGTWDVKNYNEGGTGKGSVDFANKYLIPYLKVSKNCENINTGGCAFSVANLDDGSRVTIGTQATRFYLTDGTFILIQSYEKESTSFPGGGANIYVDINGQKPPNTWGKDAFEYKYYLSSGKFLPPGLGKSRQTLLDSYCNKNVAGNACAALIMNDSWQIKDDYPWN
jgi:prepilin-type N-terminal cleavage/methylation domain-containing protein